MENALSAPHQLREVLTVELRNQFTKGRHALSPELCDALAELLTQQPNPEGILSRLINQCVRTMRPGDLAGHADFSRIRPVIQAATWTTTNDYRLVIQRVVAWMQEHHGPAARQLLSDIITKLRSPAP